jgi:hypothetical protein
MEPIQPFEVGALVEYHGSKTEMHGRYRIDRVTSPTRLPGVSETEMARAYPGDQAYILWPEGVPHKFGLRHLSVLNVRPASMTLVEETGGPTATD